MTESNTRPSLFGDEVYVACADVLGFKALIDDRPLIEIVQAYDSFLGSEKASGHLDWALGTSNLPGWPRDQGTRHGAPIGHAVFSDTVFMWTWDLRPNSLRALLTTCNLVIGAGLSNPIAPLPFRIGLAKGEVQIEPALGLYIGRGIVHAYETEQSQDWIGGSLHDSVTAEELARVQSKHTLIPLVVRHLIPRRGGSASEGYALNWSINIGDRSFVQNILNELKMAAGTQHARKYDEAIKFYDTHRPAAMDRSRN